ncbi:MAG: right-handed parallel beta-helix repeat-containing protein, partial [Bacteroidota bacterium]
MKNVLFTFLLMATCLGHLGAQVFVNANATGANDGSSWANAYTDLANAIVNSPAASQIWVASATYIPGSNPNASFLINKQLELYGGFAGTESGLAERDIAANPTILSGDIYGDDTPGDFLNQRFDNVNTVLRFNASIDNSTILDGFTISGGQADSISTELLYNSGAGIYSTGKPTIRHCTISDNFASNLGGGMLAQGSSAGGVQLESCSFINNKTDNDGGGVNIFNTGSNISYITDCEFKNNVAVRIGGGMVINGSSTEVRSSLFQDNTADFLGGGVMIFSIQNSRQNVIDSCVFENNLSTLGGGLYAEPQASMISLLVQNSRFTANRAELLTPNFSPSGGGMEIYYDPTATQDTSIIRACTFENNEAEYSGGGLTLIADGSNTYTIIDSCNFESNILTTNAFQGAGSYCLTRNSSTYVRYSRSRFFDNRNGTRGALSLVYSANGAGESLVQECDFIDNIANSYGSGLSVRAFSSALSADISIEDSYFEGNLISNPSIGVGGALTIASFLNDFEAMVNRCE